MRIWLVHLGELLPIDGNVRLYRYGILADVLSKAGHQVTRWAPTFVHLTKSYRENKDCRVKVNENYDLMLLHAKGYKNHVGLARHRFHQAIAKKFLEAAKQQPRPDLILCAMPVPEMCEASVHFGNRENIPVVIDIRDIWPDAIIDRLPVWARRSAYAVLASAVSRNRHVCGAASGIVGISDGFLNWGIENAGRSAGPFDRVFPMGRSQPVCKGTARKKAEDFWDKHGVTKDDRFRGCFFGTMASLFDLETVFHAARKLQVSHGNQMPIVICGDGPMLPRYRSMMNGLANVVCPGWVGTDEITVLMERSSVGLAPYKNHVQSTLPNKAVDYMSAGLPILGSRGGELATMIRKLKCGFEYESGNPDSFCQSIISLKNRQSDLKKMGENGFQYFKSHLEAQHVYGAMTSYFHEVIEAAALPAKVCA